MRNRPAENERQAITSGSDPSFESAHAETQASDGSAEADELARLESLIRDDYTAADDDAGTEASTPRRQIPLTPPDIVGYENLIPITAGGQGVVYEAIQTSTKRKVALKLLLAPFPTIEQLTRFEHEIECVARLRHPNIVTVYECRRTDDGRPYYAMEFVDGQPLDVYLRAENLSLEERLDLFLKIAEAVAHAHEHGVVHRDLKPANILIDGEGEPRVVDFGLAHRTLAERTAASDRITRTGAFLGTLAYAAPEQFTGDPARVNELTDVWALGVLLYEMLTDAQPFNATGSPARVEREVCEQSPPRPSSLRRELDTDLDAITLRALTKEPEHRYASVTALVADVRRFLAGEPIEARRGRTRYLVASRVRRTLRRYRWAAAAIALLIGVSFGKFIALPLVSRWTPAHRLFTHVIAANAAVADDGSAMQYVRLVTLTDRTNPTEIARRENLPAASWSNPQSLRPIYGRLMERLATAGIAVLVVDIQFQEPNALYDDALAHGLQALHDAGVVTVIDGGPFWFHERAPTLSPAVMDADVRLGSASVQFTDHAPWAVHLAANRSPGYPLPSLTLQAFAARTHPDATPHFTLDDVSQSVIVQYEAQDSRNSKARDYLDTVDRIVPAMIVRQQTEVRKAKLQPGDKVAYYLFSVPPDQVLENSTKELDKVLRADDATRHRWLADKIVVLGQTRDDVDRHDYPDGRRPYGCQGHAAAIESLLVETKSGASVSFPTISSTTLIIIAALIGTCIAYFNVRRTRRCVIVLAGLTIVVIVCSFGLGLRYHMIFDPFVPVLTMIVGCIVMSAAQWFRRESQFGGISGRSIS